MTPKEMIEVIEAFENGKQIEYRRKDGVGKWTPTKKPQWDFSYNDYRTVPTRIDLVNELIKENFGIEDCFTTDTCPLPFINNSKDCLKKSCAECKKWWYKNV